VIGLRRAPWSDEPAGEGAVLSLAASVAPLLALAFAVAAFLIAGAFASVEAPVQVAGHGPAAAFGGPTAADPLVIHLSGAGTIHVKGRRIELALLLPALLDARSRRPSAPIVVRSDPATRAALIVQVLDQLKLSGAADVRVALAGEEES
jgi:biopolymer transport protein ExbD